MKDIIDKNLKEASVHYGDSVTQKFYALLKEKKFCSTKCKECNEWMFPPREFCPYCFGRNVEWQDMPRKGILYAFTQQEKSLRFLKPDVVGLVELPGIGKILTRIDASLESLKIGMDVELDFVEVNPELVLHQFCPVNPVRISQGIPTG